MASTSAELERWAVRAFEAVRVLIDGVDRLRGHRRAPSCRQRGQLAYARARASRRLVKLVRDGEVAGIGVFVASVPGSFPFRLTDPALAATFIAHLRPLAAPDAAFVQVVVEDDPPLCDAVLALGGYVHLEIARTCTAHSDPPRPGLRHACRTSWARCQTELAASARSRLGFLKPG